MSEKNNFVHLPSRQILNMDGKAPIFYSVTELFELYPAICDRGWTEEDLLIWVSQDIITGRNREDNPVILEIEKESIEAFLEYHNSHLKDRANRVQSNLNQTKKTPTGKS